MTNEMIIFNARVQLMEEGKIGTTGRQVTMKDANGEEFTMNEPEAIHTYKKWQELGYQVKKGAKMVTDLKIWKAGKGNIKNEAGEDEETTKMFMKRAFFFSQSQVEAI